MKVVNCFLGIGLSVALLTGCNMDDDTGGAKTVVISNDVELDSIIADSNVAISQPKIIDVKENITYGDLLHISNRKIWYMQEETLFEKGLDSKEAQIVHEDIQVKEISDDGSKILRVNDQIVSVYDLEKNEAKENLLQLSETFGDIAFADPYGEFVSYNDFQNERLIIVNTASGKETIFHIHELFDKQDSPSLRSPFIYEDNIYFILYSSSEGTAIYKMSFDQTVEKFLPLPHQEDGIQTFEFVTDQAIIFNGIYNKEPGIFLYDIEEIEMHKLVSGGTDSEGTWIPFYSISPDGKNILFNMVVQEEGEFLTNVYLSMIENNQITNSVRVLEKADLPAVIEILAHWEKDSAHFYIPRTIDRKSGYSDVKVDYLALYDIERKTSNDEHN